MKASDLINQRYTDNENVIVTGRSIPADTPVMELPALLADNGMQPLPVVSEGGVEGALDAFSLVRAFASLMPAREDCSVIELVCDAAQYSASQLAMAIEDVDAHLIGLLTYPSDDKLGVTVRITHSDPSAAIRSIERYGYEAVAWHGSDNIRVDLSQQRMENLLQFMNV